MGGSGVYAYNKLWESVTNTGVPLPADELWSLAQKFKEKVYHIII